MPVQTIKLNGIPYSANDVEISFLGRIVRGITEINFDEVPLEVDKVYVLGTREPVARTLGKADYKGDITLLMNEVAGLEIAADGTIKDIGAFPLTIVYKSLPVPLKQVLNDVIFLGKALQVRGGQGAALAWKIPMDFMGMSPLKAI